MFEPENRFMINAMAFAGSFRLAGILAVLLLPDYGYAQPKPFVNTALMQVTFEIHGPQRSKPERTSFGTVFRRHGTLTIKEETNRRNVHAIFVADKD